MEERLLIPGNARDQVVLEVTGLPPRPSANQEAPEPEGPSEDDRERREEPRARQRNEHGVAVIEPEQRREMHKPAPEREGVTDPREAQADRERRVSPGDGSHLGDQGRERHEEHHADESRVQPPYEERSRRPKIQELTHPASCRRLGALRTSSAVIGTALVVGIERLDRR